MILHVFNSSSVSGPERLVLPALRELSRTTAVEVVFLHETRKHQAAKEVEDYAAQLGLTIHQVVVRRRLDRNAFRALASLVQSSRPSIVHAHDVKASFYVMASCRGLGADRPVLFGTHHGVFGRSGVRARLYEELFVRYVLPKFDTVLAVCSSDRASIVARGVSADRVFVHLNGIRVSPERGDRVRRRFRTRGAWGAFPDEMMLLGFVGRLAAEKQPEKFLYVLHELRKREGVPSWHALIFGDGPCLSQLEERIDRLGLRGDVTLMGYRPDMEQEMVGLDILLSTSKAEGLPLALLEAAVAGVVVVAPGRDGMLDLIRNGEDGLLYPEQSSPAAIARQLISLMDSRALQTRFRRSLAERVSREFSQKRWIEQLEALYAKSLNSETILHALALN